MPNFYSYILSQDMTWASVHMKSQGRRVPMSLETKNARQHDTEAEGDGGREIGMQLACVSAARNN